MGVEKNKPKWCDLYKYDEFDENIFRVEGDQIVNDVIQNYDIRQIILMGARLIAYTLILLDDPQKPRTYAMEVVDLYLSEINYRDGQKAHYSYDRKHGIETPLERIFRKNDIRMAKKERENQIVKDGGSICRISPLQ